MLFGLKNRPFVSVIFNRSCLGFALEANVFSGFDSLLCYLSAKMYGYICLAGRRKFFCSVIIREKDRAFVFFLFFWMMFS